MIDKLDEFIRKYYKNKLIKGSIYFTGLFLLFYLLVAVFEYYGNFGTAVRTALFYFLVLSAFGILLRWILIPLFKLYKLGNTITHEQASEIIGKHFSGVKDKLLNTLQLQALQQNQETGISLSLLEAGINQKIQELKPIPFTSAIDFSQNKKYLKFALVPIFILLILLVFSPGIITEATNRLVKHNVYFEKKAPFQIEIQNKNLSAVQQKDFELQVKVSGSEIPSAIFIEIDKIDYPLKKENTVDFTYLFKNLQSTIKFKLHADGFYSKDYELRVLPNPVLLNFDITINYPAYLHKNNEVLHNTGDLVIPSGTKVSWAFTTQNTKQLILGFGDTALQISQSSENTFTYSNRYFRNKTYAVITANQYLRSRDSIVYSINVIPDQYPAIQVEERPDSLSSKLIAFRGEIKDDYGFSKLNFIYKLINAGDSELLAFVQNNEKIVELPVNKASTLDNFFHYWDLSSLGILPGEQVEYYFEVWDNDGVSGAKSARTQK
ncbi:MAG: hypothetical protein IPP56_04310 [Bacteroidetes bacterium]|nr:hypothetical protein [Bacteroidota bacterium]